MRKWLSSLARRLRHQSVDSETPERFQRVVLKILEDRFGEDAFRPGRDPLSIEFGETQFGLQSLLLIAKRDALARDALAELIVNRFERILEEMESHPGEEPLYWNTAQYLVRPQFMPVAYVAQAPAP